MPSLKTKSRSKTPQFQVFLPAFPQHSITLQVCVLNRCRGVPHCFLYFSTCYLIGMRVQVLSACVPCVLVTLDYAFTESPAPCFSLSRAGVHFGVHLHPPFSSPTAYTHGAVMHWAELLLVPNPPCCRRRMLQR